MDNASVPLVSEPDGGLLIPAGEVTALLRRLGAGWVETVGEDETELEPGTVMALACALCEIADQIDVECIGFLPSPDEEGRDGRG
ncbi:DUF6213 family protein [Streptomyces sp. NPDC086023]|uniref:DUF6213 family protein n=1 Tax=Streptomyces sp. NPDC086023 TaxID=3365746 RepID=UPI0037CE0F89